MINMSDLEGRQINPGILWFLLGVFLIPTINGIEGLLNGLLKFSGLSITHRLIALIIYDSVLLFGLFVAIVLIFKNGIIKYSILFDFSLRKFRVYGLVCFLIIIAGRVTNYFILTDIAEEMKLLESDMMYDLLHESSYYYLTSVITTAVRETLLFIMFFVATIKKWK